MAAVRRRFRFRGPFLAVPAGIVALLAALGCSQRDDRGAHASARDESAALSKSANTASANSRPESTAKADRQTYSAESRSQATAGESPSAADSGAMPTRDDALASGTESAAATSAPSASPLSVIDNFHTLEPARAFRSAQLDREALEYVIRTHGIRTIINLRGENPKADWYQAEVRTCREMGVRMIDVQLSASSLPSPENLLKLYDALTTAPEPLLMHCRAGADRTGMAAALWRILRAGEDAKTAGKQLSIAFGHFRGVHPEMMDLVNMFVAKREWIQNEYPKLLEAFDAAHKPKHADKADD